jgi:hypothetical protein
MSLAVIATLAGAVPAAAQDAATIQSIQQQIQQLQAQLRKLQADAARRDAQLKQAQDDAAQARMQAQQAQQALAAAPPPAVVAVPAAPVVPPPPPLPLGTFRLGGVTVTLGGFAAGEAVYRSRNQATTINSNFNSLIPLRSSANYNTSEFRESAQQSRISLLAQGDPNEVTHLTGYFETDFLAGGSSSNSNESNSYTLRVRQAFASYERSDWGLHLLGGQAWTLATMDKVGITPRQENVPLTIDAQYAVGFTWARQPQFRVVEDFADHRLAAGLSVESPQTTFSSAAGPNCLTGAAATVPAGTLEDTQCGGNNVNTIQAYSNNKAPDIIAKLAADPGWGHYEVYGMLRFFDGQVVNAAGAGTNFSTTGGGVGGGMILPVVPSLLDFQLSGLYGRGVGRYGPAQIPDVTIEPSGKLVPLTGYQIFGGFVGHPIPTVDVYAYGGAEGAEDKWWTTKAGNFGYGNPNAKLAGCDIELGSCSASTSSVVEGTVGAWWRFLKRDFGTMQVGVQYAYLDRNTFQGIGATKGSVISPSTNENMFLFSFRYYPFQ